MIWKYNMVLRGQLRGPIWWPAGRTFTKDLDIDLGRYAARFDRGVTLRQLLLSIQMEQGGDFQSCDFTAETEIIVSSDTGVHNGYRNMRYRYWPITAFKSVHDLVEGGI